MIIGASGGGGSSIIFIILIGFLLVYLLFVRPQRKRQLAQQQQTSDLRVGDEVLTAGGIYGTISAVDEDEVTVQIAPQTEVRVARRAIAGVTREGDDEDGDDAAEPEEDETAQPEEPQDEKGSNGVTSNEENRG